MTEATNGTTTNDEPKALIPKLSAGEKAAKADPAELADVVLRTRDALNQLAVDPTLPTATRDALVALAKSASSQKRGMEEMETTWRPSRCTVVQPTTRSDIKPPSARPGDIFDSGGQLLVRPTAIIPLYIHEENVNFPEGGKNPVCSAPDAKLGSPYGKCIECPHLPFGKQNGGRGEQKKTDCQNAITVIAMTTDLKQILQFQFAKTSRKAGGILMSLAGRQDVLWQQSYLINTEKKTNEIGLYYIYTVESTSKDNPEDVRRVCEAFYELIAAQRTQFLADYYSRPVRASLVAAEAEGRFSDGEAQLAAGLGGGEGEEPDLDTPAPSVSTSPSKGARNSSKPM